MERLTEYHGGIAVIRDKNRHKEAMEVLAKYEDTELTPEQVQQLKEREELLLDYIMRRTYSCPIRDNANINFEKECVSFGELGCRECIMRHLKELK